jgi:hypothetical protein
MANRKLSRPLELRDGRTLRTLRDAIDELERQFASVTRDDGLVHAIKLMEKAAKSGKRADIEAATRQVGIVLRFRGLIE